MTGTGHNCCTLLVAEAAHWLCADLCLHNTACVHVHANMLYLFHVHALTYMQESLAHCPHAVCQQ